MSFVSNYLIKTASHRSLAHFPAMLRSQTAETISLCKLKVDKLTEPGPGWYNPNALHVLQTLDKVSSDCCEIADSCGILSRQYAPYTQSSDLHEAVLTSSTEIMDFFNSDYLNLNQRLLTLLVYISYSRGNLLEPADQALLNEFIKFLTHSQKCGA